MALPAGRRGVRPDQVKPDGTLNITEPIPYDLPVASAETLGGVKVGSGLAIADGVLSASGYSLPTASAETLGGVKVGSGLAIADGVLSAEGGNTWPSVYDRDDDGKFNKTFSKPVLCFAVARSASTNVGDVKFTVPYMNGTTPSTKTISCALTASQATPMYYLPAGSIANNTDSSLYADLYYIEL